ncbi:MAG: porin, partial [Isosphaeraceae bacterium]
LYFDGHLTRPIEYQISFQESYDTFNLLSAFLNFNYDKRLQFRIGRFKTPYTYEFYKVNVWNLYAPERSIYNVNFALNRQLGAMFWGELFENRVEYAIGAFDGARNSYQPYKSTPDAIGFLNFKPFEQARPPAALSFLRDFNIGGSGSWGNENNPLTPAVLRTSTNASSAGITSTSAVNSANVPFLAFNNNVTEKGARALWELHMAYYYKGLTLLGAWDSGYESWAVNGSPHEPVRVPVNGYSVQAAYLLTGETRTATGLIDPLRRFDLRPGRFGLGAWEPTARFADVSLGKQVFTGGLADPNLWTNQAYLIDVGVNWYLNRFVKVYFDWEHAIFGQPVAYSPGQFSKTNNLFWLRVQSFF